MDRPPKIDELVGAFLRLKARVWEYCDGDPALLLREAKRDAGLIPDCVTLHEIAKHLEAHEASAEMGLIFPVNETFRREWNDYVHHWRRHIFDVWLYNDDPEFLELVTGIGPFKLESVYRDGSEEQIAIADRANFYALSNDLESAELMLDEGSDEQQSIHDLAESLEMLWRTMGFSLQGAFDRASQTPVALIPPKVANKITPQASLSLFRFWNEARKTYVLGASMASIAMARAALEVLLTDVHKAQGSRLEDKIQYIKQSGQLPGHVMHRIQKAGDSILHALREHTDLTAKQASQKPTQISLQLLRDLKQLIEES